MTITSRDIAAWERVTKGMTFAKFQEQLSMAHLYDLTHRAARRTRVYDGTLAEFESSVDLDLVDGDDEANPTSAGASSAT